MELMIAGIVCTVVWMLLGIATTNLTNRVFYPRKKSWDVTDAICVVIWPASLIGSLFYGMDDVK